MGNNYLNNQELAKRLLVSNATIRNWKREGLIPKKITKTELERLLPSLQRKQNDRANKTRSAKTFIPRELISEGLSTESIKAMLKLLSIAKSIKKKIALCATLILWQRKEITIDESGKLHYRRASIGYLLREFYPDKLPTAQLITHFQQLNIPLADDLLGLIYQSLLKEGKKSQCGSYFTPKDLTIRMFRSLDKKINSILDPCCGSGIFLCTAAQELSLPLTSIYGIDKDPIAVFISKINLLLHFTDEDTTPKVVCHDALRHPLIFDQHIDLIISNPPWGAIKRNSTKDNKSTINTNERASKILLHTLQKMDKNTKLMFLLPCSLLNIKAHKETRTKLLEEYSIKQICYCGKPFDGVLSDTFWIETEHKLIDNNNIKISHPRGNISCIPQNTFLENTEHIININANEYDLKLLRKIYHTPHITLKNNALWSLGIVTGDNKKYISTEAEPGRRPIIRGCDIKPYRLDAPQQFIEFKPSLFRQFSDISFFDAPEKLVYRFISSSLVFAYDESQHLTLNSANILIPQIIGYPIKAILGILNSKVIQYVFTKTFATHKVLKADLCKLPIPLLDDDDKRHLMQEVDKVIHEGLSTDTIDEMIFRYFSLTKEESDHILGIDE